MPFAGHPTVGAAVALQARAGVTGPSIIVLEEKVGPVRCAVNGGFAEFDLPKLPRPINIAVEPAALAAALGLDPQDIGFENHRVAGWSAGVPFVMVPVSGLLPAAKARVNADAWIDLVGRVDGKIPCPYIYCRETVFSGSDFHARMFAPWDGIGEDPATGSAAPPSPARFAAMIPRPPACNALRSSRASNSGGRRRSASRSKSPITASSPRASAAMPSRSPKAGCWSE
ncbi:MAG: PhzF family phenazine biosynthesis protein [Phyllobacteriaceae bacterium]|nr:PhzF family phenazine biosynthesis protein [Phyllobacteriaceae bacterium]